MFLLSLIHFTAVVVLSIKVSLSSHQLVIFFLTKLTADPVKYYWWHFCMQSCKSSGFFSHQITCVYVVNDYSLLHFDAVYFDVVTRIKYF